ncbi:uncharacterized protein LOC101848175 [Aplysia californica]|uniref:Uncharacterized protein LOC101848175 n=1 Tax=Aplysia californica TaxID=6500 RepID=A0ABM0JEH5_APLCA|nr:uncharacterized protein LOC101848175 [Aplysia californica]
MAASLRGFHGVCRVVPPRSSWNCPPKKCWFSSTVVGTSLEIEKGTKETVEYPPIKPKYPEGSWGKTDRSYAWMWHSLKGEVLSIPKVSDRQNILLQKETDSVVLEPVNEHPSCLPFRQYVTKTHLIPWTSSKASSSSNLDHSPHSADLHDNLHSEHVESIVERIKQVVSEHLITENELVAREQTHPSKHNSFRCKLLFRCISDAITTHAWKDYEHLRMCQYDEDVIVRALWHRIGIEREKQEGDLEYSTREDMLDIISKMDQTVMSKIVFDAMLRHHHPLPQVKSRHNELCTSTPAPELLYGTSSYGHSHSPRQQLKSISAGHKLGDPCEFGMLGFLSTCETNELEEKYNRTVAEQSRLALGLTSSFTWLAAQTFNQGFSDVVDMTYPLTCQTVLSDGRSFSFLMYQLNTLELWQDNDANGLVNLCWHTPEMPLYHSIDNGQVRELNEDVIRRLVQMFLLSPVERDYDMKPTVTDKDTDLHLKQDFIPERVIVEKIIREEQYIV